MAKLCGMQQTFLNCQTVHPHIYIVSKSLNYQTTYLKLILAKCVRPADQHRLATIFGTIIFSFFPSTVTQSPRRGCRRVPKFCMGSQFYIVTLCTNFIVKLLADALSNCNCAPTLNIDNFALTNFKLRTQIFKIVYCAPTHFILSNCALTHFILSNCALIHFIYQIVLSHI